MKQVKDGLEKKRAESAAWRRKNPNYAREYHAANREKANAYARDYYAKNKAKWRGAQLNRYGVTSEELGGMMEAQGGGCAICKMTDVRLEIDHCHTTGKVRGLLCGKCNKGIGLLQDDAGTCDRAAEYLRR